MSDRNDKPENDARFSLYLPSALLEEIKVKAARERRRANEIVVEAVQRALAPSDGASGKAD